MAMTAHVIYTAIDSDTTITQSKIGIDFIRNQIGYDGLIMTDDLSMKALIGLNVGCDVILYCNGDMNGG